MAFCRGIALAILVSSVVGEPVLRVEKEPEQAQAAVSTGFLGKRVLREEPPHKSRRHGSHRSELQQFALESDGSLTPGAPLHDGSESPPQFQISEDGNTNRVAPGAHHEGRYAPKMSESTARRIEKKLAGGHVEVSKEDVQ